MTALTLSPAYLAGAPSASAVRRRRSRERAHLRLAPCAAPALPVVPSRPVSPTPVARPRAGRPAVGARAPLRLTRRGRLTVTALVIVAVTAAVLTAIAAGGGSTFAVGSTTSATEPLREVLVLPGETLWSIAGEVDPKADRRDVILEIRDLNGMQSSQVLAGQTLLVPTG